MFKVGDRVRVIEPNDGVGEFKGLPKGTIAEIVSGRDGMWEIDKGDKTWFWRDHQIELYVNESPVREVTRREIIDGEYGGLHVAKHEPGHVLLGFEFGGDVHMRSFSAEQLSELIHVASQIREVLEDV